MGMLRLVEFQWYCGRMGEVSGLTIYNKEEWDFIQEFLGGRLYLGEVLGKHSEIFGPLTEKDLTLKSDDQDFLKKLVEIFPGRHLSGTYILDYLEEEFNEWKFGPTEEEE